MPWERGTAGRACPERKDLCRAKQRSRAFFEVGCAVQVVLDLERSIGSKSAGLPYGGCGVEIRFRQVRHGNEGVQPHSSHRGKGGHGEFMVDFCFLVIKERHLD